MGTRSATATEMALAIGGVGVDESSALGRNVFGVKRVVFPVAQMSVPGRRRLGKRLMSELDAVRDLLSRAELYSCVSGAAGKGDRLFAPGAPVEEDDGCRAAKSRKVSPFADRARESKRDDRERLAGRLASMVAVLPDHVVAFLQNRRVGDADSRGDDGEIEMDDVHSMKDGALFQLKMLLDKFAPESSPKLLVDKFAPEVSTPKSCGRCAPLAASGIICLSQAQHQEAGARMPPVQEEEEEGINICGGVSRIEIRDIAEEYGELVNDIGVQLLSPLQRKYVDLAEEDRYVDICGDASPVVFPAKTCDSSSPSLSTSSDSDATSTDSDSSSSSPEALPKEHSCCRAGEPVPAPESDLIQGKHNTQPPEPAPEAIHIAEPENQCAPATVFAVTKSPPSLTVLPKECGTLAQPPEQAPETVQIAEPEELKEKCAAPGATVHPITGSAPPPAVLPNENGISSQPAPVPAPVAAQIAEPQPQPQPQTSDLIDMARQEGKRRAMAKARQELLKLQRAALPDERIHPLDMELLGIAAFEHVVSTVRDARTAQPQVNDEVDLRVSPGRPSILQQLGVFLKADGDGEEEQLPPLAVASDGEDMDMEIEDGQIL
ncbi:unnamed protein product [Miscanthus lutarioriparius]|uniref:NET domain-containing protein n=1 Tax=Miscanthus lutarioriparius TaxID=422564 RepID=A0A811PVF1_9POAL|nr:unnamed protein product [Miscanthus lutarioriparius]